MLYHELCVAGDNQKEVRVIFLDISKAFDKVWHKGLLHKMKKKWNNWKFTLLVSRLSFQ